MSNFSTFKNLQTTQIPTGSIVYHSPFHNKKDCVETGKAYLQSQYPSLFSIIGRLNAFAFTPVSGSLPEFDLVWTGTMYVGSGRNIIHRSTDGSVWTTISGVVKIPQINTTGFGNGFVMVASPFVDGLVVARSADDGATWKTMVLCGGIQRVITFNSKYTFLRNHGDWWNGYGGIHSNADNATGGNGIEANQGNEYYDAVVVGTQLTACGTGGKIRTTTDGVTWTARTSGTSQLIVGLLYANSLYIYSGGAGVLATSTDAITWTARTSGTTSNIYGLAYGAGVYVYGGIGGVLRTSTDAITWTPSTSGTTQEIRRIIFANGIFTYVGAGGVIATSTDGTTWTPRTSNTTSYISSIIYENGLYVYGTIGGGIGTSTDSITWTARSSNSTGDVLNLIWDGSRYVTCGYQISTSTDGVTWTNIWRGPNGTNGLEGMAYSPTLGMFAGIGYNGFIVTSSDNGLNWVRRTNPSAARFDDIKWVGSPVNMFVGSGQSSTIVTSSDGVTWTQRSITGGTPGNLYNVCWNGTYIVINSSNNNAIVRSIDGITWTYTTVSAVNTSGTAVTFPPMGLTANSTYTIGFTGNSAFTSLNTDLVNWVQRSVSTSANTYAYAQTGYSPTLNRIVVAGGFYTDNGVNPQYSTQYNVTTEFIVPNYTIGTGTTPYKTWIKT